MTRHLRIGTRGSQLAMWQAGEVSRKLQEGGYRPEIVVVKTTGDVRQDVPLAEIGGKGLFIKELEEALLRNEIDLAVHSLKDVPSIIPDAFVLAGYLERADPRDAWLHPEATPIGELREGAVIGTSSPRRRAQLLSRHPRLRVEPIRGNVETRIQKMHAALYDGIVLASAGLQRLGREADISSRFEVDEMIPAAGQGIVAVETLKENEIARAAAASVNHRESELAANAERGVLQKFGERLDCNSCVAVHATIGGDGFTIRAFLSDYEATQAIRISHRGLIPSAVVDVVAQDLMDRGAMELLT